MPPALPDEHADEHFMRRALELATETVGLASPNPHVGCVLTRDNVVLGEGAHLYDAFDHAEIAALKQASQRGVNPSGATAYVTLEPCSHHGRTGPCADALIRAGIARVVVATQDPNPQVSGRGIARLRAAGIDVSLGTLQQPARNLNDPFAHFIRHRKPLVTLKAALSVDGKLAPNPAIRPPNQPFWLTGHAARADVHRLRHASDAILTGIGTILADNPHLTDRSNLPRRRPLLRVILDTHLRTPISSQVVHTANDDLLILGGEQAPEPRAKALAEAGAAIKLVPEEAGHLSIPSILAFLGERNILSVLLEVGSSLNSSFLQQNLVDKAVLYYAETELGSSAIPFARAVPSPYLFEQRLSRVSRTTLPHGPGEDARVSGYLHDPWADLP